MSIVLLGATSGSVTLQEPAVAGTTVIDLPATSGTMAVLPTATGVLTEAAGGTGTTTGYYGFKNRIINGGMQVWQRATSQSATGYGSVDRWILNSNNTTITRSTDVPAGFRYSSQMVGTSAANAQLTQRIESLNCDDLNGQAITVSFWAKSTAGSTQLGVYLLYASAQDNFTTTTAVGLTTQNITLTSSWAQYSITFTSSAPSGVANGLQLGLFRNGTESSTTFITGVQLEKGSTATSFDYRPYGTELALCQRYYTQEINTGLGGESCFSGNVTNTAPYYANTTFKVTMRVIPTVTLTNHTNLQFAATAGTAYPQVSGFVESRLANATGTGYFFSTWVATAEL